MERSSSISSPPALEFRSEQSLEVFVVGFMAQVSVCLVVIIRSSVCGSDLLWCFVLEKLSNGLGFLVLRLQLGLGGSERPGAYSGK